MAKGKKADDKVDEGKTLQIDVDSFVRTRDSVVKGLSTLQDAIRTLSSAYISHTNLILGEHATGLDVSHVLATLGDNPLLHLEGVGLQRAPTPEQSAVNTPAPGTDKKERKKRQHDPNAPKRPLTPFFLYMQTARPIITNDLGPETPKGAVSTEGTRRWATMAPEDKQLWSEAYKDNLRLYTARMHSYKSGNIEAKDMSDAEASVYAEEHALTVENTADAQLVGESSAAALHDEDADGEVEAEKEISPSPPPPQPKTPSVKAKGGRKSKGSSAKEIPAETPVQAAEKVRESTSVVPVPGKSNTVEKVAEKDKSPEKKRKRVSKKSDAVEVLVADKEELAVETPKSSAKPRKKKAKSDA